MYEVKNVMKNRVYFVDVSLQNRIHFFRVYFFEFIVSEFIFWKPSVFLENRVYFCQSEFIFKKNVPKLSKNKLAFETELKKINSEFILKINSFAPYHAVEFCFLKINSLFPSKINLIRKDWVGLPPVSFHFVSNIF